MPDLISHAASAFLLRNAFRKSVIASPQVFLMVVFGIFLPDIVSRGVILVSPEYFFPAQYFHTPFSCFLQTVVISSLFVDNQRKNVFWGVTAGWVLHQIFDACQEVVGPGNFYFFWPIYEFPLSLGLFSANSWPYVAITTILLAIMSCGRKSEHNDNKYVEN